MSHIGYIQYYTVNIVLATSKLDTYCRYILESADIWNHGFKFLKVTGITVQMYTSKD